MSQMGVGSCVVVVGRFWIPEDKPFSLYSRDHIRHKGNVEYWSSYFYDYIVNGKWKGSVKSYAIYRTDGNKGKIEPPIYQNIF